MKFAPKHNNLLQKITSLNIFFEMPFCSNINVSIVPLWGVAYLIPNIPQTVEASWLVHSSSQIRPHLPSRKISTMPSR